MNPAGEDVPEEDAPLDAPRLGRALESSRTGVWEFDVAEQAVRWTPVLEALCGLPPGGFAGTWAAYLDLVHPDDREAITAMAARGLRTGEVVLYEHRVIRPDGETVWISGSGAALLGPDGRATAMVGTARDVTAQHRADEALRQEVVLVETLNEAGARLSGVLDRDVLLQALVDVAVRVTGAQVGAFAYDLPVLNGHVTVHAIAGGPPEAAQRLGLRRPRALAVRGHSREPVYSSGTGEDFAAQVAVALVGPHDEVLGGLFLGSDDPQAFDARTGRLLIGLANQAAVALANARLYTSERAARSEAEQLAQHLAQLQGLARRLASARSEDDVAHTLVQAAVGVLGAASAVLGLVVHVEGHEPYVELVAGHGSAAPNIARWQRLPLDGSTPVTEAVLTRGVVSYPTPAALAARHPKVARGTVSAAVAVAPLLDGRTAIGSLTLGWDEPREVDAADEGMLLALADHGALALRRVRADAAERRAEREQLDAARSLQQALLPPSTLTLPGLEVAARYHPVGDGSIVGGDFYDAFVVDGGTALLVGDVSGKGVRAAALTGLARFTARAVAVEEPSPSAVLRRLNAVVLDQRELEQFATVVLARLVPGAGCVQATLACAGHPPALVLRAAGGVEEVTATGTALGLVADPTLHDVTVQLDPGDALVLYTDGILEARDADGVMHPELLGDVLATCVDRSAEDVASRVDDAVRALEGGLARDDVALLVVRVPSVIGV